MTKALLRAPDTFFTPFAGGGDRTLPIQLGRLKMTVDHRTLSIQLGRLKMTVDPELNGRRLWASFNGGQRKITAWGKRFYDFDDYEVGALPEDLFEDYGEYKWSVNIWWDVGWCPPPLNFDVSKIGISVIESFRRLNTSRPIYFRVYGNAGELLPKMAKDTVRIISDSGFKLAGFEVKDDSNFVSDLILLGRSKYISTGRERTLMIQDLVDHDDRTGYPPISIHMVIVDGRKITACDLYNMVSCHSSCLICVEAEQESVDGVWRWKPLWPVQLSSLMEQCKSNGCGNSLDEGGLYDDDDAKVNTLKNDKVVSIWWDFVRCPLPLNFNSRNIASNITKALRRLNLCGGSIYFHTYGDVQEAGEDIIRFVCESGFQIEGFRLDNCKRPKISFDDDLKSDFDQRYYNCRPPIINIVISDGYRYRSDHLDSLYKDGNIIMPFDILLDEGPHGVGLPNDLFKDDENIFLEHYMEFEYLVGHQSRHYKRSVNIWWDASRCPPPLNFDLSKIGITIVEVMCFINISLPIYLRVYGNRRELLPKMAKGTKRILSKSGIKLAGFKLKDNSNVSNFIIKGFQPKRKYFSPVLEENLMMEDLIYYCIRNGAPPQDIHMVVLDGKVITKTVLDQHCRQINCQAICLEPEQEAIDGVWHWKPLQLGVA